MAALARLIPRATPRRARAMSSAGPLAGVRVLDLSRVLAGPMCSQNLADLGADVWKVERPGCGDDTRAWGPPHAADGTSTYFLGCNRNKRSLALDLQHPDGRATAARLAARADVVLENFLPGKADELGLGFEALSADNPRLIYCSISGYGGSGPYSRFPGYDVIVSALGGLIGITGSDEAPAKTGVALIDQMAGLHAQAAISAALYARATSGRGQRIEVSLLDTCVHSLANIASSELNSSAPTATCGSDTPAAAAGPKRWGTAHPSIVPYQAFDAADGKLILGAGNDGQWRALRRLLGEPESLADERYDTNSGRVGRREELLAALSAILGARSVAHWLELLSGSIPCAPLNSVADVFADAQVQHNRTVVEAGDGRSSYRGVKSPQTNNFGRPAEEMLAPPRLGEHSAELLREVLEYRESEIEALAASGCIQLRPDRAGEG